MTVKMAMEQIGYVTKVSGDTVRVRVMRESACGGNCSGCHGCPPGAVIIECKNDISAPFKAGDAVKVEMPERSFFSGVFFSYGIMTVTMLLGAVLGYYMRQSELASVAGGFLGLAMGAALMKAISKKQKIEITIKRK